MICKIAQLAFDVSDNIFFAASWNLMVSSCMHIFFVPWLNLILNMKNVESTYTFKYVRKHMNKRQIKYYNKLFDEPHPEHTVC